MFVNREKETEYLRERYKNLIRSKKGQMLVIYGRRRVGKTILAQEFLKEVRGLYLYVDFAEEKDLFGSFSGAIRQQLGDLVDFQEVDRFFEYLKAKGQRSPLVVVLDEFQRFHSSVPKVITRLQKEWDLNFKDLPIMWLLVGSSIGMMEKVALSPGAPLFGRATGILKIKPFGYAGVRKMFPEFPEDRIVEIYGVFGGTPHYLDLLKRSGEKDILKAIEGLILEEGAPLREEPRLLLLTELQDIRRYNSMLHAVAAGKVTVKEIADQLGIEVTKVGYYLQILAELMDLITPQKPILGKNKMGRYKISDHFFRFWYRFVYPNFSALELGNIGFVRKFIKENLNAFMGWVFEEVAREFLIAHNGSELKGIPLDFTDIGSWWDRSGEEIDVVAVNEREKTIVLGEVKWYTRLVGRELIEDLLRRKEILKWMKAKREESLLALTRSGLTEKAQEYAEKSGVKTLTLEEMRDFWK